MQIETTMRYHLTLVRTAIIKRKLFKPENNTYWQDVEKLEPLPLLVVMQDRAAAVENSMDIPPKNLKRNYHIIQQSQFWVYIQKN